jgi:hypothetical protein
MILPLLVYLFLYIPEAHIASKSFSYLLRKSKFHALPLLNSVRFSIFLIFEIEANKCQLGEADNINVVIFRIFLQRNAHSFNIFFLVFVERGQLAQQSLDGLFIFLFALTDHWYNFNFD